MLRGRMKNITTYRNLSWFLKKRKARVPTRSAGGEAGQSLSCQGSLLEPDDLDRYETHFYETRCVTRNSVAVGRGEDSDLLVQLRRFAVEYLCDGTVYSAWDILVELNEKLVVQDEEFHGSSLCNLNVGRPSSTYPGRQTPRARR